MSDCICLLKTIFVLICSTFTCYFCNEEFRKDYKLKLHLMLNHKSENPVEMSKAKEVLTKSKLDGCVHKCAICSSKYNSVANFSRHIKDVHNISRAGEFFFLFKIWSQLLAFIFMFLSFYEVI